MSNTEPTEEHRRAAVMHHYKYAVLPDKGYLTEWVRTGDATGRSAFDEVVRLARLLAEREAKLEEHIKWLETQCVSFEDANINNQKIIKALNEENQRYCEQVAIEKRHWSNLNKANAKTEVERDTLRARVAELEATTNSAWVRMAAAESAASNYEEMLEEAQKREAQHLADIKALRGFLRVVDEDYDHDEDAHRYGTACRCCMANHLRHRLAHYDDAKAAEGEATCPKCTDDARPVGDGERWVCSVCRRPCRIPLNDTEGGEG